MLKSKNLLQGTLIFDRDPELTTSSTIKIVVEDISFADAQAKRIVEKTVDFDPAKLAVFKYVNFELGDFDIKKGRDYSFAVHVDVTGDGEISENDFITSQTYPVITGLEHFDVQLTKL